MKLPQMFDYVVSTISQPGLFNRPIVNNVDGKWTLDVSECVKMLSVCYCEMHSKSFEVVYEKGAQQLWEAVDEKKWKIFHPKSTEDYF